MRVFIQNSVIKRTLKSALLKNGIPHEGACGLEGLNLALAGNGVALLGGLPLPIETSWPGKTIMWFFSQKSLIKPTLKSALLKNGILHEGPCGLKGLKLELASKGAALLGNAIPRSPLSVLKS